MEFVVNDTGRTGWSRAVFVGTRALLSLLRVGFFGLIAVTSVAIALGRYAAPAQEGRLPQANHQIVVDGFWWHSLRDRPRLFDPVAGQWSDSTFPAEDLVAHASVAPWSDGRGESQVVARWSAPREAILQTGVSDVGLARYSFPTGKVLDRVKLDIMIAGKPCWFPDRSSRILFPAGDGLLYRYAFDDAERMGESRVVPLRWATDRPGGRTIVLNDPFWPIDPQWEGKLFVSLNALAQPTQKSFAGDRIWWLELDPEGKVIEGAGRVTEPVASESGGETPQERCPSVAITREGGMVLAYLHNVPERTYWELRVASLSVDGSTGVPHVRHGTTRILAEDCALVQPVFSPDGRSVYAFLNPRSPDSHMGRIALPEELLSPPASLPARQLVTQPVREPVRDQPKPAA